MGASATIGLRTQKEGWNFLAFLGYLIITTLFCIDYLPLFWKAIGSDHTKLLRWVCRISILFAAGVVSSRQIAEALQLPVTDFPRTFLAYAGVYWVGGLFLLAAFLLGVFWVFCIIQINIASSPIVPLIDLIRERFFPGLTNSQDRAQTRINKGWRRVQEAAGALFLLVPAIAIPTTGWLGVDLSPAFTRRVAYYLDYQPAQCYPGLRQADRVVFHGQGVVSVASPNGNDIDIRVLNLKLSSRSDAPTDLDQAKPCSMPHPPFSELSYLHQLLIRLSQFFKSK